MTGQKHYPRLIDHVYVSNPENVAQILVPKLTISDHYAVAITRKLKATTLKSHENKAHKSIRYRDYKHFDPDKCVNDLEKQPWSSIYDSANPNDALDVFNKLFIDVLNKHAPVRNKRVRKPTLPPYLDADIISLIKRRDALKDALIKGRATRDEFNSLRNQIVSKIRAARRSYFRAEISKNGKDPKKTMADT